MYGIVDFGTVAIPSKTVTNKMEVSLGGYTMPPGHLTIEVIAFAGTDNLYIDAHTVPLVYAFTQRGYTVNSSCGGHLNTREGIEPVHISFEPSMTLKEAKKLALVIKEKVRKTNTQYLRPVVALGEITVEKWKLSTSLNFFHTMERLYDDNDTDDARYGCTYPQKNLSQEECDIWLKDKYERRITPEVWLEWNKTIMIMQLFIAILELPMRQRRQIVCPEE